MNPIARIALLCFSLSLFISTRARTFSISSLFPRIRSRGYQLIAINILDTTRPTRGEIDRMATGGPVLGVYRTLSVPFQFRLVFFLYERHA